MFTVTATSMTTGTVLATRTAASLADALATKTTLLKHYHRHGTPDFALPDDFDDWADRGRSIPVHIDINGR